MADTDFQFILSTANDVSAKSGILNAEKKRVVRVQAMRDFRRKQREEFRNITIASAHPKVSPTARSTNGTFPNQRRWVVRCQDEHTPESDWETSSGATHQDENIIPRCRHGAARCQRCQGPTIRKTQNQLRSSSDFISNLAISTIRSPPVNRSQLRQELVSIFHPASSEDTDFIYSRFLGKEHLEAHGASMTSAVDTLCLLHIGTHHNDKALIQEASFRRDVALTYVMRDLRRQDAMQDDEMLGAMWILNFCDSFPSISKLPQSARTHIDAAAKIVTSRAAFTNISPLGQVLLYNIRSSAFNWGLFHRKPILYSKSESMNVATLASPLEADLIELMLQIPDLLDLSEYMAERSTADRFSDCPRLNELCHMENQLISWLLKWMKTISCEPYYMVPATAFPHFAPFTEGVAEIFTKAIQFPSFAAASLQMSYWIGLMQVKQAIVELIATLPPHELLERREANLLDDINECAAQLCQSAAFTSQPKYGFCGVMRCISPLYFAAKWYLQQRDYRRIEWCKTTITRIQERHHFTSPYGLPWADYEAETGPSSGQ